MYSVSRKRPNGMRLSSRKRKPYYPRTKGTKRFKSGAKRVKDMKGKIKDSEIGGVVGTLIPQRTQKTFITPALINFSGDAGSEITLSFMLNSCNDPYQAHAADQPMGWDLITNELYAYYRVWSGFIEVSLMCNEFGSTGGIGQNFVAAGYITIGPTPATTFKQAMGQPGAQWIRVMGNNNSGTEKFQDPSCRTLKFDFKVDDYYKSVDEVPWTAYTADPVNTLYLHIIMQDMELGTMYADEDFTAICKLGQRVQLKKTSVALPLS